MISGFYKCNHCYKFSKDPLLIKAHEEACLYNPANKHCNSCVFRKKVELTAPKKGRKTKASKAEEPKPNKPTTTFALGSSINALHKPEIKVSIPSSTEESVNTGVYEYVCKKGHRMYLRENKTGCNHQDWQPASNTELKNRSNNPEF